MSNFEYVLRKLRTNLETISSSSSYTIMPGEVIYADDRTYYNRNRPELCRNRPEADPGTFKNGQ